MPAAEAATPATPDVFGTTALALSSTPLDSKWRAARSETLTSTDRSWAQTLQGQSFRERIDAVNVRINAAVRYAADRGDQWQSARQTLSLGRGDCEDYALAKMALLEAAGVPRAHLVLTITRDLALRVDHAVLIVRDGEELLLLDNLTNRVSDAATAEDYRPVFSYSASGQKWLHGYTRKNIAAR